MLLPSFFYPILSYLDFYRFHSKPKNSKKTKKYVEFLENLEGKNNSLQIKQLCCRHIEVSRLTMQTGSRIQET